jgi:hypothetical protein
VGLPRKLAKCGGHEEYWSGVKFKLYSDSPLVKKARRGFRGFPVATVALYGPDDKHATKAAVGIVIAEGADTIDLKRWFVEDSDIRTDRGVAAEILEFIESHEVKSVAMTKSIIGCPHEEGVDYPNGKVCPQCPFWAHRDRWAKGIIE